jgi:hypothetical protein
MALGLIAPDLALAGIASPQRQITESSITVPGYELAQTKRYKRLKPGCRAAYCKPGYKWAKYRKWQRKKYFGRIIAGVAIGTIIVTAANATPRRPSNDLCWYWTNSSRTRGYWDYCY